MRWRERERETREGARKRKIRNGLVSFFNIDISGPAFLVFYFFLFRFYSAEAIISVLVLVYICSLPIPAPDIVSTGNDEEDLISRQFSPMC